jgi:Flp pilus assembly protein TadG
VLVAPLIILLVLVMVGLGRATSTHLDIADAAHQAARAASLARDPTQAQEAAQQTAEDALANAGLSCREPRIAVDTGDFTAGGRVTVTVSCTTDLTDLGIPFPGVRHTSTGRSSSPIDRFRQTGEAP